MKTFVPHLPAALIAQVLVAQSLTYPIVDTNQTKAFAAQEVISAPKPGSPWYGQDASYQGRAPSYRDNGDGTVSDLVTGLMWQQNPGEKMTLHQAQHAVPSCRLGGYTDWRLPTIKELYSLIQFSGEDVHPSSLETGSLKPFIDHTVFAFRYGDPQRRERIIDSQYGSSTLYTGKTMWGSETVFGVNFSDGRIKGYPVMMHGGRFPKTFFFLFVRGNPAYGTNRFVQQSEDTVVDEATGLMWTRLDSGQQGAGEEGMSWQEALQWAESLTIGTHENWRLPNAKELHSLVEYHRSPQATGSAAIHPMFELTMYTGPDGRKMFPALWTSTTHQTHRSGRAAVTIHFGEAKGWMYSPVLRRKMLLDVHGAGAQRSDHKLGSAEDYPYGRGPQGDVVRMRYMALAVRDVVKP